MCVRPKTKHGNIIPCGKCFECKKLDRVGWSIRVQDEMKEGTVITLTYNNENVPEHLNKKHLQDYVKRLREHLRRNHKQIPNLKDYEPTNFKYFGVGEYGDRFGRPHYHIIFNIPYVDIMQSLWSFGNIYSDSISNQAIHYCTKYVTKNSGWKKDQDPDEEKREFRIMSKGMGKKWLSKYKEQFRTQLLTYRVVNGIKYPLPRYYRNAIFGAEHKLIVDKTTGECMTVFGRDKIDLSKKQQLNAERRLKELAEKYGNMLRSEADENKRKYFERFNKMYESLKLLNKIQ